MFFRKQRMIKSLESEIDRLDAALDEAEKRLNRAGSLPYQYLTAENAQGIEVEIKPIQWGKYIAMDRNKMTDAMIEEAKVILAEQIARGLIEKDIVQYIVHCDFDPLNQTGTVAGKLYVIPWEQMTARVINARMLEAWRDGK